MDKIDLYNTFISTTSDEEGENIELEYRYHCDKTEYEAIIQFLRQQTQELKPSVTLTIQFGHNIRMEIQDSGVIESYCATNFIPSNQWKYVKLGTKHPLKMEKYSNNSKVTMSRELEKTLAELATNQDGFPDEIKTIMKQAVMLNRLDVSMFRKLFRLRHRTSFMIGDSVRVDLTQVKQNQMTYNINGIAVRQGTLSMKEAKLHSQKLEFELEIEALQQTPEAIQKMKDSIKQIESVIQKDETTLTLPRSKMNAYKDAVVSLIQSHYQYVKEIHDDIPSSEQEAVNKYKGGKQPPYIIPKLVSMTRKDIPIPDGMAVTDKADGESCIVMLFDSQITIFDSSFHLLAESRSFSEKDGSELTSLGKTSLFAGEFIQNDRGGLPHMTAYLYDCYMWGGKDVRRLNLVSEKPDEPTRIKYVNRFTEMAQENEPNIGKGIRLRAKQMRLGDVQKESLAIWNEKDAYPYILDGVILTPAYEPVGKSKQNPLEWGFRMDRTWHLNIKWKPPQFNTVDFILEWQGGIVRGKDGLVRKALLRTTEQVTKHNIRCTLFPLFQPSEYSIPQAYKIEVDTDGKKEPRTEETNEYIQNHSVVECRYDVNSSRWIVLRNRKDKTSAWKQSKKAITVAIHRYKKLIEIIMSQSNWKRTVLQQLIGVGAKAREIKQDKLQFLYNGFVNFLVFHSIVAPESDERTVIRTVKHKSESILSLLNEPYVEIPLPFALNGSNSTFVANTIWKSIHEPVHISDFYGIKTTEGGATVPVPTSTSETLLRLPIDGEVQGALVQRIRSWIKEKDSSVLEISNRDTALVEGSMLWTNKVSIRKTPQIIRGNCKKFKQGWISKDDKETWNRWKEETSGARTILTLGIWEGMDNIAQRRGAIDSITKSANDVGTTLYVIYWDSSKTAKISKGSSTIQRKRGGHIVVTHGEHSYELKVYPEDKMIDEFGKHGWIPKEESDVTIDDIVEEDEIAKYMSVAVFHRVVS